ncbi:aromatic prenyltransferase [Crassisporium funariophilum]|nr:aromatic prenyltransferase [Crassisporium funariophilum]
MLESAKYPVHAQTSHLVFWWARLNGLLGPTDRERRSGPPTDCTSDDSLIEFSWVLPRDTDPSAENNRAIRFCVDPFHPDLGHRLSGGAVLNWLWSDAGSLGLVRKDGDLGWKDTIEQWMFPDISDEDYVVPGATYFIGKSFSSFDMEPSGAIGLKQYYMPPFAPAPGQTEETRSITHRLSSDPKPFKDLVLNLHPSLEHPFSEVSDYLENDPKGPDLGFIMIACDITKTEKNRLKLYYLSPRTVLKDIIYDLTLGGRLKGQQINDFIDNFKKLIFSLFPSVKNEDSSIPVSAAGHNGRNGIRIMYYYELFVNDPMPWPKFYFFMDHWSKDDLSTCNGIEAFLRDVGKPGEKGWLAASLGQAGNHRSLGSRKGMHTMVSFGTKPSGWETTIYYSSEMYAPERDVQSSV